MFIGHIAVGFCTKRLAPETSLGWHVLAPCFLDLLFPVFVLTGIEHVSIEPGYTKASALNLYDIPWSHSLLMSVVWSLAFAGLFYALMKNARTAGLLALGVFSHFVLDVITHRPEMQLYPGSPHTLGLDLWDSLHGTLAAEFFLLAVGSAVYGLASKPLSPRGKWSFVIFVALLAVIQLGNNLGGPPPNVSAVIGGCFGLALFAFWAHRFDTQRTFAPGR